QRDAGTMQNVHFALQEANIGHMPPPVWEDWRIWMYRFTPQESITPTGAGNVTMLTIKTHKGSVAFANPAFTTVSGPDGQGQCVVVSYFLFGEGAKPGEGGSLVFYHRL